MACLTPYTPEFACCAEAWETYDPDLQARATALAWSTLRVLSGGRVGNCAVEARPCLNDPCSECGSWWAGPYIREGVWYNAVCGCGDCTCEWLPEVTLPGSVAEVLEVYVDGVLLPETDYRLDNGNSLVRMDGEAWPSCADSLASKDAPGSFVIVYVPGVALGEDGLWAAGVLACEYAKACSGGKCRLPSSVTSISRQGVSMELSSGMFANNMTGIREVDAFLVSVNPYAMRTPPRVWSPDMPTVRYSGMVSPT